MSNVYTDIISNFFDSQNRIVVIRHYNNFFMDLNELEMNTMMAMDFEAADNLFQLCLRCVNIVKSNSVRVCNISKIYGMRALCNYELGRYYNTMINLQYAEQFMGHIIYVFLSVCNRLC